MRALHITSTPPGAASVAGTATGDILVWNATAGRYEPVAKGAADTILGVGAVSGNVGYTRDPRWRPKDRAYVAESWDSNFQAGSVALPAAGTLTTIGIWVPEDCAVTSLVTGMSIAGATLTAGQNKAALYLPGPTWTLLGVTADQKASWETAVTMANAVKEMSIVGGPVLVPKGLVFMALWYQGTTSPAFWHATGATSGPSNAGLTAANYRSATADTLVTTTAPATLGTLTPHFRSHWGALKAA